MATGVLGPDGMLGPSMWTAPKAISIQAQKWNGATVDETVRNGAWSSRQPIDILDRTYAGGIERAFYDDFYNRIYLLPSVIDYKAVAVDSVRTFDVWNAWLTRSIVANVTVQEGEGTDITGPAPGTGFAPLAIRRYQATAFEDGPAEFNARYRFAFDTGEAPTLTLLGERARRLPATPSWPGVDGSGAGSSSFSISYEFKTEIITSRSGREQRRALRQTPRKGISYSSMVWGVGGSRAFNRHMRDWQNRVVVVPEEPTFVETAVPAALGATVLQVERIPPWLRAETAVFIRYYENDVLTEVTAIDGDFVTIGAPLPFILPKGGQVMLAAYGRMASEVGSRRETNHVFVTGMDIAVTPASEELRLLPEPDLVLNGRPVFEMRANWRFIPNLTYIHPSETLDFGLGRIQVAVPIEFSSRRVEWTFSGRTEKVEKVVDLFHRMRGRAGEFYYASWEPDLPMDYPVEAATRTLTFDTFEIADEFADDTVRRAVAVVLHDERVFYNVLQDPIGKGETTSIMTFQHDWPEAIAVKDVLMVCWVYATRLASDKLEVEWLTNEVATAKLSFLTLEDLPA